MVVTTSGPSAPGATDDPGTETDGDVAARILASRPAYAPFVQTFSPFTGTETRATRLAWRVIVAATSILVALLVGIPATYVWYVGWAIEVREGSVRSIDGVVFLQRQGVGDWIMADARDTIEEGDVVRTALNARAFVQFFDGSTALVYPNTTVTVLRSQVSRFRPDKYTLILIVHEGRMRFGVAAPTDEEANAFVQARVPGGQVHLSEGSYSIDVAKEASHVTTRRGIATVHAGGHVVTALTGQRAKVEADRPLIGGLPSRRDLIANPVFANAVENVPADWEFLDISERDPGGKSTVDPSDGSVMLSRKGTGHGETILSQVVDVDLWDFERVNLEAGVRVLSHSLSGGGWQGSEYPIMLRVTFRDITGSVHAWTHGFYLQNDDGFPVKDATYVTTTEWQRFDASLLSLVPRPWRIIRVEVIASGWDYASSVKSVHLWAE